MGCWPNVQCDRMLPGLVHDNPGDGGPGCVPGAVTLTNLHLDLAHLLTPGHLLHQNLIMQLTVIRSDFLSCRKLNGESAGAVYAVREIKSLFYQCEPH